MTIRTVSVALMAKVSGYTAQLAVARKATSDLFGEIDKLGKESPEKFNRLTIGAGVAGTALLGLAGMAVKTAMEFDKQMSSVAAVAGATADEMGQLRQAALDAGKDTVFSATESAQAEEELAKAGISVKDILGGALPGALNLASAGQMGLADAATIAAQAMNIFGLRGAAVPHIADVLASAANKSAADMHDLGDALRQGGLVAKQAGLSLEDTTGTLAAFADRALIGSDAGTSLKSMLLALGNPSEKAANLMRDLGIKVYDTQGRFVGITKLAGSLQESLSDLTQAQRDAAMATIFGSDATRSANVLYNLGEKGLRKYIDAVNDSGAAADTAGKKTDNLAGDIERLKGSIETLAIEAGSGASGGLRHLVKAVDWLVTGFSELPGPVQSTATVLVGVSGAGLLAAAGLLKARQTAKEFLEVLAESGPVGAKASGALRSIGGVAGKLGLVGLAVGGIWMGMNALSDWAARKHAPLKANIDKLTTSMLEFASTGKAVGELADKYGAGLSRVATDVAAVTKGQADLAQTIADVKAGLSDPSIMDGWDPVDPQAAQRISDLDEALSQLVTNGNATQAGLFLEQLRASGTLTEAQYASLIGMLPKYSSATHDAATANTGLAKGFADAAASGSILTHGLQEQIDKGQKLTDIWMSLHGALLSSDKAMLDANQAIAAVGESFKENGRAIEGNSDKALRNRIAIEEAAKAAAAAAQAKFEETGDLKAANKVYDDYIDRLRESLKKEGLKPAAIQAIIDKYTKMPPLVTTQVNITGNWATKMTAIRNSLAGLAANVSIAVGATTKRRWGGITEHARDGLLRDAAVYSPQGPARYAFAEPATGGEAFVPKNGDARRSLGIVDQAARWYGHTIMPTGTAGAWQAGGGSGTRTVVHEHRHTLVIEGTGIVSGLRREIRLNSGDVQKYLGGRLTVGG